jgi:hypothetical protein
MSKYSLIDLPVYIQPELYEINVSAVASALMNHGKVQSVYRIGSVTAPGISDLDVLVVFKDGASTAYDPLKKLDEKGHYLFVHRLFGVSNSHFQKAINLTQFHNYRLIGGEECRAEISLSKSDDELIKIQTALEFMVKMYMVINFQREYKIIKVRAFLLEARAMEYDLQYLGVSSGPLFDVIQEIIHLRKNWFLAEQSNTKIDDLFDRFYNHLVLFLSDVLLHEKLYTPHLSNGRFVRNVRWSSGKSLSISKKGIPLPSFLANVFHRKYFNMMNKVTGFSIKLPIHSNPPAILDSRFSLLKEMTVYNKKHIPEFMAPGSSLNIG